MAIATVINFVEALRASRVLTAAQVEELARDLQARFPEPRALARELIQRDWVTPYQVNQVFPGRGQSLVLGPYLLVERLGEGGTGRAFRAWHEGQNRSVVVKLVRKEHLPTPEAVQAVYRDFAAAGKLSHPNLAANHAITLVGDTHVFVMEYVEGIDLGKLLKQRGHLAIGDACSCVRQAALGMQHAHEHGLVHRDLKPNK